MPTTGDVELTILDGGAAVVVPSATVQVVLGTAQSGTVGQVVATRNGNTLKEVFTEGPLVQAGAMTIARGGTVLAVRLASATAGAASAVTSTAVGGTSAVTVTGTPRLSALVKMKVITGGTIGAAGIRVEISLDAGRTFGPTISLGTANTLAIGDTGASFAFGAGTLVATATYTFGMTEPLWDTAGVQAALNALELSPYALAGWGSMHLTGIINGANAATINGFLNTLATRKVYTRLITAARDLGLPTAYGGTPESEATWSSSLLTDFGAVDAKRVLVTAGHYNLQSAISTPLTGLPKYRLPLSYALAAKQVTIAPQRHAGRVRDGSITEVIVDPTNDPVDGFTYHDERLNPSFRTNRFAAARTRIKKSGFYFDDPNLMSAQGSVFSLLPLGIVMDIACGVVTDVGQDDINEDVRLNKSGTIWETDARTIERNIQRQLEVNMVNTNMLSAARAVVDRDLNVRDLKKVKIAVTIWARGYVLEEDITIGYGTAEAA